jgi:hypothetical protein
MSSYREIYNGHSNKALPYLENVAIFWVFKANSNQTSVYSLFDLHKSGYRKLSKHWFESDSYYLVLDIGIFRIQELSEENRIEENGMEQKRREANRREWNGTEENGMEQKRREANGSEWNGIEAKI